MKSAGWRPRASHPVQKKSGFTLIEVMVTVLMLGLVMGMVFSVLLSAERLFSDQLKQYTIDQHGWRIMDRLSEELREAYPLTILPLAISNSSFLTYQRVTGHLNGVPQLGPLTTLSFQQRADEIPNGVDDNGDGRIDEGFLAIREAGQPAIEIAGNVMGVRFSSIANGLSFSVDIQVADRERNLRQKTFTQEISFRTR
jgi:prepilin-type N-terminal cleavage/methylation domain-containing protein